MRPVISLVGISNEQLKIMSAYDARGVTSDETSKNGRYVRYLVKCNACGESTMRHKAKLLTGGFCPACKAYWKPVTGVGATPKSVLKRYKGTVTALVTPDGHLTWASCSPEKIKAKYGDEFWEGAKTSHYLELFQLNVPAAKTLYTHLPTLQEVDQLGQIESDEVTIAPTFKAKLLPRTAEQERTAEEQALAEAFDKHIGHGTGLNPPHPGLNPPEQPDWILLSEHLWNRHYEILKNHPKDYVNWAARAENGNCIIELNYATTIASMSPRYYYKYPPVVEEINFDLGNL